MSLWTAPGAECAFTVAGFLSPEDLLLAIAPVRSCDTFGGASFVHISGGVATTGATWSQDFVSFEIALHRILPRSGGAWLAATTAEAADVQAIDALGSPIGDAFHFESEIPVGNSPAAAFLDGGFALLLQGDVVEGIATARIVVSDGEGVTTLEALPMPSWLPGARQVTLVGSPNGRQLLVAYPAFVDISGNDLSTGVLRLDCVQPL